MDDPTAISPYQPGIPSPTILPPDPDQAAYEAYEAAYSQLSNKQQRFLALRNIFKSDKDAAKAIKMSHYTITKWLRNPTFAFCSARSAMPLKAVIKDLLISNGVLASSRVAGILSDPAKPDDPVLRAAEISYKALGLGKPQATISVNIYDIEQAIINQEAAKRGIELI